jgi:hypothetical protein
VEELQEANEQLRQREVRLTARHANEKSKIRKQLEQQNETGDGDSDGDAAHMTHTTDEYDDHSPRTSIDQSNNHSTIRRWSREGKDLQLARLTGRCERAEAELREARAEIETRREREETERRELAFIKSENQRLYTDLGGQITRIHPNSHSQSYEHTLILAYSHT